MRTPAVVGIVVVAHIVAVGSVALMQGCGTMAPRTEPREPVVMEPIVPEPVAVQPAPEPTRDVTAETTRYVVRKGESLSVIANRYGFSTAEVAALNSIDNPNMIRVGQTIMLPGAVNLDDARPVRTAASVKAPPGGALYTVKAGDTLSGIAKQSGVTVKALREANGISGDRILVGQKLAIPGGGAAAPVPAAVSEPTLELDSAPVRMPDGEEIPQPAMAMPMPESAARVETAGGVSYREYTVEPNEDLYSVAMMWNVSVADIKALNALDGIDLEPGQKLKIPVAP
jgi:LysM repeat protein